MFQGKNKKKNVKNHINIYNTSFTRAVQNSLKTPEEGWKVQ